jgi:hypothetical protein
MAAKRAFLVVILLMAPIVAACSRNQRPAEDVPVTARPDTVQPTPTPEVGTELPAAARLPGDHAPDPGALPRREEDLPRREEDLPRRQEGSQPVDPSLSLQASLDSQPPPADGETVLSELGYVSPSDKVRDSLADPPGAKRLSQQSPLWVDIKGKRVFADGYVAQREAYLELFACPAETKEHESVVAVIAQSSELHAALLAVGAMQGTPVQFDPQYVPAAGQPIRVWVMWYDEQGNFQSTDARRWVRQVGTEESLQYDWVFAGSSIWTDPADGKAYYQADSGEMICVSNFPSALMDLPIESSIANTELQFDAFTERIPPRGTPLRLMLVPIPSGDAADEPATTTAVDPDQPPTADLMPMKSGRD